MTRDQPATDEALLGRVAEGNAAAFEELARRHGPALLGFARRLAPDLAEDVLQTCLLDALRGARTFAGRSAVKTWLFTLARNAAHRLRKREARHERDRTLVELGVAAGWSSADPERIAICAQRRELLESALDSLRAGDREVLVLRDIEQLSGEDTAAVLGVTLATMKSRLHRARLRLAEQLRGTGGDHAGT